VLTDASRMRWRLVNRMARVFAWALRVLTRGQISVDDCDGMWARPTAWKGDLVIYVHRIKS
jgi:hypothetical protein